MSRKRVNLTHTQKEWIKERDGRKCVRCGSTKRLEVHHIVSYSVAVYELHWTFERANNPDNLILLCHEHHLACHNKPEWDHDQENRFAVYAYHRTWQFIKRGKK